ncbi:5-(carboxyamino)imidazole ribonucleotide synthase [Millisia brevis]|uniref:5-(carboxyamino)imidazole ribonucleotide synthase n=1 Tax=Millisia brevis TaxID=264148 RepID=UPI000ABF6743
MVGGGQLARMTHQAAVALGQTLRVLAADAGDPAALVSPNVVLGSHDDLDALRRVAEGATALTFDHEHVPTEYLRTLVTEGVAVHPPPEALIFAQDKAAMRRRLAELGYPVPPFAVVATVDEVRQFVAEHGPAVLKTTRGGYDGRGVWFIEPPTDDDVDFDARVSEILASGVDILIEQRVPMVRELSAMVARSPYGQGAAWPVVETVQRNGQCAVVLAPAPGLSEERSRAAQEMALGLAQILGTVGVMAVEMFETVDGLVINELAMRPHNSGHWSMNGCVTSQFEQHVRAVVDYPLGATTATAPVTVMANVLGAPETPTMSMDERVHHLMARFPDAHVHLYGKGERKDRKIGHVNIVGPATSSPNDPASVAAIREKAELAAHWLSHGEWTDGWKPE